MRDEFMNKFKKCRRVIERVLPAIGAKLTGGVAEKRTAIAAVAIAIPVCLIVRDVR